MKNSKTKLSKKAKQIIIGLSSFTLLFGSAITTAAIVESNKRMHETSNNTIDNTYYYEPGVIKFDENGKVIVPKIIDKDNLNGIYQYNFDLPEFYKAPDKLLSSKKYMDKLNKLNKDVKSKLLELDVLKEAGSIVPNKKVNMLIKSFVPNIQFDENKEITMKTLFSKLYDAALDDTIHNETRMHDIKDLYAIQGKNFQKEFDESMSKVETQYLIENGKSMNRYTGFIKPVINIPPKIDYTPHIPNKLEGVQAKELAIEEYIKTVLENNEYYQNIFLITYRSVLISLCILNAILTAIAGLFFGITAGALVSLALDIASAGVQIHLAKKNLENTRDLIKGIKTDMELIEKNQKIIGSIISTTSTIKDFWNYLYEVHMKILEGTFATPEAFETSSKLIIKPLIKADYATKVCAAKALCSFKAISSVISIFFGIIMSAIETSLIHYPH